MMEEQASQAMLLQHRMMERKMLVLARWMLEDTTAQDKVVKVSTSRMEEKTIMVDTGKERVEAGSMVIMLVMIWERQNNKLGMPQHMLIR
jgi:hypothetical protein